LTNITNYEKSLALSAILVVSTLSLSMLAVPTLAATAPANWTGVAGSAPYNWDNSPQTQVGPGNVQSLQVNWVYPIPPAPAGAVTAASSLTTPLIVDGVVYTITEDTVLVAQNVATGSILWQDLLCCGKSPVSGHYHGIDYTASINGYFNKPIVWVASDNGTLFGINALKGDFAMKWNIADSLYNLPANASFPVQSISNTIPGNNVQGSYGFYNAALNSHLVFDTARGILFTGSAAGDGNNEGRGFLAAYNFTTAQPKLMWRTFIMPPQDGSDPNWSVNSVGNMTNAYMFDGTAQVDLKSLPTATLHTLLYRDWGNMAFNGSKSFAGANPGWGGAWALDPSTGTAYIGTAQAGPDFNASIRPGPNLWGSSIMSVNEVTGKINWGFQSTSHDVYDMDCSFSVILGNVTISGQTHTEVFKGCKSGYEYALNAATGKMDWFFGGSTFRNQWSKVPNPLNQTEMMRPWANAPSTAVYANTHWGIESNPAYDPATHTIFLVTNNVPLFYNVVPVTGGPSGYGAGFGSTGTKPYVSAGPDNMTVWGVDSNTGQPKWHVFLDNLALRGGYAYSNGLLFVPVNNGAMDIFNGADGTLLRSIVIGTAMVTEPAIGSDLRGNTQIVEPAAGSSSHFGGATITAVGCCAGEGAILFSLALPNNSPASGGGVGSVTTSTVTITTGGGATNGIDPTTFYAVAGVAAILAITSAALALRMRKPGAP